MTIWTMLIPFELAAVVVMCMYLYSVEKQARYLKRQERRQKLADELPKLAQST